MQAQETAHPKIDQTDDDGDQTVLAKPADHGREADEPLLASVSDLTISTLKVTKDLAAGLVVQIPA